MIFSSPAHLVTQSPHHLPIGGQNAETRFATFDAAARNAVDATLGTSNPHNALKRKYGEIRQRINRRRFVHAFCVDSRWFAHLKRIHASPTPSSDALRRFDA